MEWFKTSRPLTQSQLSNGIKEYENLRKIFLLGVVGGKYLTSSDSGRLWRCGRQY